VAATDYYTNKEMYIPPLLAPARWGKKGRYKRRKNKKNQAKTRPDFERKSIEKSGNFLQYLENSYFQNTSKAIGL